MNTGSKKADRTDLLKNPETPAELIRLIKKDHTLELNEKAFLALAVTMGARVTEICRVKQRDITFLGCNDKELPKDKLMLHDVYTVHVGFSNLKNKKKKYKNGAVIKTEVFVDAIEWLVDRTRQIGDNPDTLIYGRSRIAAWGLCKRTLGNNFFPHKFRHCLISDWARKGVAPGIVKDAAGWRSLQNWDTYAHLSTDDLDKALRASYGGDKPMTPTMAMAHVVAANQINEYSGATNNLEDAIDTKIHTHPQTKHSIIATNQGPKIITLDAKTRALKDKYMAQGIKPLPITAPKKELAEVFYSPNTPRNMIRPTDKPSYRDQNYKPIVEPINTELDFEQQLEAIKSNSMFVPEAPKPKAPEKIYPVAYIVDDKPKKWVNPDRWVVKK